MVDPVPHDAPRVSPRVWILFIFISLANLFLLVGLIAAMHGGGRDFAKFTEAEAISANLAILQAFLAALAIGLAVVGAVGFTSLRSIAIRRAEEAAMARVTDLMKVYAPVETPAPQPDLAGLPAAEQREEEGSL